ncbi:hypothetical protein BaGK_12105 [Bacillus atrophaeus]|nr:hypothetical protein BaGK_12105 [Bacillus atrophaeus]
MAFNKTLTLLIAFYISINCKVNILFNKFSENFNSQNCIKVFITEYKCKRSSEIKNFEYFQNILKAL